MLSFPSLRLYLRLRGTSLHDDASASLSAQCSLNDSHAKTSMLLFCNVKNSRETFKEISRGTNIGNHPRGACLAHAIARVISSDAFQPVASPYRIPLARLIILPGRPETLRGYSLLRIRYFPWSDVAPGVISRDLPYRLFGIPLSRPRRALPDCSSLSRSGPPFSPRSSIPTHPTNFHEIT